MALAPGDPSPFKNLSRTSVYIVNKVTNVDGESRVTQGSGNVVFSNGVASLIQTCGELISDFFKSECQVSFSVRFPPRFKHNLAYIISGEEDAVGGVGYLIVLVGNKPFLDLSCLERPSLYPAMAVYLCSFSGGFERVANNVGSVSRPEVGGYVYGENTIKRVVDFQMNCDQGSMGASVVDISGRFVALSAKISLNEVSYDQAYANEVAPWGLKSRGPFVMGVPYDDVVSVIKGLSPSASYLKLPPDILGKAETLVSAYKAQLIEVFRVVMERKFEAKLQKLLSDSLGDVGVDDLNPRNHGLLYNRISNALRNEHGVENKWKVELTWWLICREIDGGAGIHDEEGQGMLHIAAALGYDWIIRATIAAGVSVNSADINGWTPLHWAASCGRENTVELLLRRGAAIHPLTSPSKKFRRGATAADLAKDNGHDNVYRLLVRKKRNVT